MNHRSTASIPTARYDDFLFAPICEEANGMRLSVLSALARMNVDPWEEATRLAAMPRAIAEKTLVSILDLVFGARSKLPEAQAQTQAIAARLVQLLPQPGDAAAPAATASAKGPVQRVSYWWVWVCFALAMSFLTPHHQAATSNPNAAVSTSGTTSSTTSDTHSRNTVPDSVGLSR